MDRYEKLTEEDYGQYEVWEYENDAMVGELWAIWQSEEDFSAWAKGRGWKAVGGNSWKDPKTGNLYEFRYD